MERKKKKLPIIGALIIVSSLILALISVFLSVQFHFERKKYYDGEDISYEYFSVPTRDGTEIKGIMYIDKDLRGNSNQEIPTILMLNGINSRKEDNFGKALQLIKRGYGVFVVEQRGHGETRAPSAFLKKEPQDMIEVLDFITEKYKFTNTTHIGILGFSYGGGIGAILQALDDRIYCSVLYHPLTSLEGLTQRIPFQYLTGNTPAMGQVDNIEDAFDIATKDNSQNMLLLHGDKDILIVPEESESFYNHLNGPNREDIQYILRPDLDHGKNEGSKETLKFALAWIEHYYQDDKIDINNLDDEITNIDLYPNAKPTNNLPQIILLVSMLLLFLGLSITIISKKIGNRYPPKILPKTQQKKRGFIKK